MNLAQTFAAERALARHCSELTERGPRPEERAECFALWRRDLGRELGQDISELLSGDRIEAAVGDPETLSGQEVFGRIGPVAANSLLRCGASDRTALLSFNTATAIALTDRSFGGTGEVSSDEVAKLPRSAALLIEQASRLVACAIARVSAVDSADGAEEPTGEVIVRSENASRLKPFGPSTQCASLTITLTASDDVSWSAALAMPQEGLDALLPGLGSTSAMRRVDGETEDQDRAVFGAMPLALHAVLAEFDLSLGQLGRLKTGDEIPIAVARDIPLRVGVHLVASGRLGTQEDRMALQLTRVPGRGVAA
ncbi:MAG: FliM/FliN family flagellar motor switch protein [Erythrobacter sp.]|uniref:FliM/FliN family flagellar motor switch protein n=1 Tax=Erythrobacter sp. TaxID=1042 RepID=UPI002605AA5D|nr:FliM/FliN family flagellar motor switch protein [Erythrobacter sp.]MDJ0979134.1 FliM/FliN family flagellar motor switch protein [Erythrobacter sp.]